ncbi:MAG: hypothetical protein LBV72_13495 [Tannerella sp.]|nr:hypothetical protein [Tannerella sp.]
MHYSGEPLVEEQDITDDIINNDKIITRAALNPYELKVSFWSTSNFIFNGCGVEISYKEANNKGKLQGYNTNLGMYWQGIVTTHKSKDDNGMGQISRFGNGYKYDTGSSDKKTFGEVGGVFMHRFKYYLIGGSIWGTALHSSGTTIQKGQFD